MMAPQVPREQSYFITIIKNFLISYQPWLIIPLETKQIHRVSLSRGFSLLRSSDTHCVTVTLPWVPDGHGDLGCGWETEVSVSYHCGSSNCSLLGLLLL